jgi:hypothetical protein
MKRIKDKMGFGKVYSKEGYSYYQVDRIDHILRFIFLIERYPLLTKRSKSKYELFKESIFNNEDNIYYINIFNKGIISKDTPESIINIKYFSN